MPRGEYALFHDGREVGIESFTSAPGPMGWRYFSTVQHFGNDESARVDLSIDARGRTVRARVASGGHELMVVARGATLAGIHDGVELALDHPAGTAFAYPSPGFFAVALHRLSDSTDEVVLAIDPTSLVPKPAPRRAELLGEVTAASPAGAFDARRWLVDGHEVTIADTVVVNVHDLAHLRSYEPGASGPVPRLRGV